jgi:mannosyltransferase
MEKADALISISESTRSDLLRIYPRISASKVHVVPLAAGSQFFPLGVEADSADRPYALFVGARAGYKNFEAAARGVSMMSDMDLVCVGGGAFTDTERALLSGLLPGRHKHSGYVGGLELNRLYNSAHCLVYPSLYEGFGIPILEAMAAGCPVITTRRSSMAEIALENAVMLDDPSPEAIAAGLLLLLDSQVRANYSALGKKNAQRFSWAKVAAQTLQVYSSLE